MKLYHGSLEIVRVPEIRVSNRTLDYGSGFYTTTSKQQATSWIKRRMQEHGARRGYVNVYSLDEGWEEGMDCLSFASPTEEWLDFVMSNRMRRGFEHCHDIVYGPVANDKVYAAFALYEGGVISKQELTNELRTYRLVDQMLFHTTKSLQALTFINYEEVYL